MDQKYREFEQYNWTNSVDWQRYYGNLFPVPAANKMDKIKKKWYQNNVDKDFDVTYDPSSAQAQSNAGAGAQNNQQQFYQQFQNQAHNPAQQQYLQQNQNVVDRVPMYQNYISIFWVFYFLSMPLGFYTNQFAYIAIILSIMKTQGMIQFNMQYLQQCMLDDSFQMLGFCGILSTSPRFNLIIHAPVAIHGIIHLVFASRLILRANPQARVLSQSTVKSYVKKGLVNMPKIRETKHDFEVYTLFYLIIGTIIGQASFIQIMLYLQVMRIKVMMNPHCHNAWKRVNQMIEQKVLANRFCPEAAKTGYATVSSYLASQCDFAAQQAQQNEAAAGGGMMGGLGSMMNRCNIF